MSVAEFIAHYVLHSSLQYVQPLDENPENVDPATGASDWHGNFLSTVAPAIKLGCRSITEAHRVELIGFAKILADNFYKIKFDSITATIVTDDLPNLSWGRLVALFTFLSFVSAELVEKDRSEDLRTLEQWFVEFLSRKDLSNWVAEKGGWASISYRSQETSSLWFKLLAPLKMMFSFITSNDQESTDGSMEQRERDVVAREQAIAEREGEMDVHSRLDKIEEKVGMNTDLLLTQHRQLEERVGEIATNQLWEVKVTHDGQRAQAERDNQLHGAIDTMGPAQPQSNASRQTNTAAKPAPALSLDDLQEVRSKIYCAAVKWKGIGLYLGLSNDLLDIIAADNRDVDSCLTAMLSHWLKKAYDVARYGEPSWQTLREAVRDKTGGNNPALANTLLSIRAITLV